jgi:hypothetical protein
VTAVGVRAGLGRVARATIASIVLVGCGGRSSAAAYDPQLHHDLMHALVPDPVRFDEGYPQLACAIVPGLTTVKSFQAGASRVPGWDVIAVVGPYNDGPEISGDPLLVAHGSDVCSTVADIEGWPSDSIYDITLIRHTEIVGHLWLRMEGDLPASFVISRAE